MNGTHGPSAPTPSKQRTDELPVSRGGGDRQLVVIQDEISLTGLIKAIYGKPYLLALDIVTQANPHISDFDRLPSGHRLWLPPLLKDTLTEQQPDGSYRLVVGVFPTLATARPFAQSLREKGFLSMVSTYQLSPKITLSRVEIEGLANREALDHAWTLVNIPQMLG